MKVAHDHLKNEDAKNVSKTYFVERTYNIGLSENNVIGLDKKMTLQDFVNRAIQKI